MVGGIKPRETIGWQVLRITWFGGSATRIHIGGKILLCDHEEAGNGFNRAELISGADRVFRRNPAAAQVDLRTWRRRPPAAAISEPDADLVVREVGPNSVLVDAAGEPPLLLLGSGVAGGRWVADAVLVAFNPRDAKNALMDLRPRVIVLAFEEALVEATVEALRGELDGTSLVALEKGMALEV